MYNAGGLSFAQSECVYGYEGLLEVDPRLRKASWAHLSSDMADLSPKRADMRPNRTDLRLGRVYMKTGGLI